MRWIPAAMIVCSVVFELLTPAEYAATPLFAVACVTAGAILSRSGTAWTVAVAVCATVVLAVLQDRWGHVAGTAELADVAAAGLAAFWVNWLVERQQSRLAVARGVAEEMQRVLLPAPPPVVGGLEIAARYEAAHTEARVGGDFYAVQETPFGLRMILGDVRGKGLGAVATVSALMGAFREGAGRAPDLVSLAGRLEDALEREERGSAAGVESRFATAILAEVPRGTGSRLALLNRGHPPAYLVADGRVRTLLPRQAALPLGLRDLASADVAAVTVDFPVGAVLVMVTDGVTEARDSAGEFYDPQDTLAGLTPGSAREVVDALSADTRRWEGGTAADDRAILAVRRAAATARAGA